MRRRQLLQPQREAPAPPPASTPLLSSTSASKDAAGGGIPDGPKRHNSGSKKSPKMPVRPAPTPASPVTSSPVGVEAGPVNFHKLKQWLKRHRLHKYATNFANLTYTGIVELTVADLERLGITAKGARTKMLKSIADLKFYNAQREQDLVQVQTHAAQGLFQKAIQGMADLLQLPNSNASGSPNVAVDGLSPSGLNLPLEAMAIVQDIVVGLLSGSVPHRPAEGAVAVAAGSLAAFLEQAIRLEFFSVDQRSQLFNWKSAAENAAGIARQQQPHHPARPARPASSGSVLDARSKGFEPKWRSVDPPRTHTEEPAAWKVGTDSVWGASVMTGTAGPTTADQPYTAAPGGYSSAVARRAVKGGGAARAARPYSTGHMFQIQQDANLGPDSVSLRSMSSLGSGDLFDPIWGGAVGGGSGSNVSSANGSSANIFTEEPGAAGAPSQVTDRSSSANTFGLAVEAPKSAQTQNRLSSEFSRAWHDDISKRERAATDAPIPSFWGGEGGAAGETDIQALTLSMTAMLDDDAKDSVI